MIPWSHKTKAKHYLLWKFRATCLFGKMICFLFSRPISCDFTQCGNYENSLPQLFAKSPWNQVHFILQMNLTVNWFDETISKWEWFFYFSTLRFMKKQYNVVENWNVRNREIVQNHEFPYWMSDLSVKISECTFSEPTHAFYMIFATVTVLKNFCHFDFSWNQSLWIWKPQENWKLTKFRGNKTGEIAIFMTEFSIIDFT